MVTKKQTRPKVHYENSSGGYGWNHDPFSDPYEVLIKTQQARQENEKQKSEKQPNKKVNKSPNKGRALNL